MNPCPGFGKLTVFDNLIFSYKLLDEMQGFVSVWSTNQPARQQCMQAVSAVSQKWRKLTGRGFKSCLHYVLATAQNKEIKFILFWDTLCIF